MLIHLNKNAQAFIECKVREGEFRDASEVIDVAVRQLAEREEKLRELRAALQIGIDQLDRGERIPFTPALMDSIWVKAKRRHEAGIAPKRDVLL